LKNKRDNPQRTKKKKDEDKEKMGLAYLGSVTNRILDSGFRKYRREETPFHSETTNKRERERRVAWRIIHWETGNIKNRG